MKKDEIKAFIAKKVSNGESLSAIQDELTAMNEKMTFMELRLLASELESEVFQKNEKVEPPAPVAEPAAETAPESAAPESEPMAGQGPLRSAANPPASPDAAADAPEKPALRSKTVVELSQIARPGAVASGSVKFGSGASADWFLDQMGRLALEKANGKPDEQDIREFQAELQKAFGA